MKAVAALLAVAAVVALSACDVQSQPTGQQLENQQQAIAQQSLDEAQPLPAYPYSQIKQNMIELESAEATGIQSTTFMFGGANALDPIQVCPSIGVPIPSTASLSNPLKTQGGYYNGSVIAQEDPNGVYMPTAGSGTFVMCVQPDGSVKPVYAEGNVHSVFGAATWDFAHHQVVMGAGSGGAHFSSAKGK